MKIRTRLTLFYAITFTFIIFLFSTLIYLGMRFILFNEIDRNLDSTADAVVKAYPEASPLYQQFDLAQSFADNQVPMGIEIVRSNGEVIYRSEAAKRINLNIVSSRVRTTFRFMNYKIEQVRELIITREPVNGAKHFRVLMKRFYFKENFIGWVQVIQPVDHIVRQLGTLKNVLLIALLVSLLIILLAGYFLSKSSLRPIQQIIASANKISHSNLSERIRMLENKDELQELANTLNNLFDRLDNAFQSQKQFISDAAHELRTPLAILRTGIEAEINNETVSEENRNKLIQNLDTVSRLSSLVEKLLLLSRLENARIEERRVPTDIGEMLSKAAEDIGMMAEEKNQQLVIETVPELLVNADPDLLYQALFNILTNAVKYTPHDGKVTATARASGTTVEIQICDNGIGINEEEQKLIFNRFYRADKSRGKEKGYGLGLAITRQIILLHKGRILLHSAENKGTTVSVILPQIEKS